MYGRRRRGRPEIPHGLNGQEIIFHFGNAIEAIASRSNDALLYLDELKEIAPRAAGSTAYMLVNGQGKGSPVLMAI